LAEIGIWLPIDKYINAKIRAFIYFNFVALPWVSDSIPKSLMIHVATFLKYPETLTRKNLKYLNKFVAKSIHKKSVESYTLSNHSANLLFRLMGIKFLVASPGASPFNQQITNKKSDGSILFIGTLEPRKNLLNLIEAYAKLDKEVQLKHSLIIAGRTGWGYDDIAKKVKINSNIVIVESPTDKEVEELYSNAACLVMPSIFEGFGIPVLDAVNYGLPVITSKDSPMEEILGKNGAIYINPLDIDSIKDGMNKFFKYDKSDIAEMLKISKQNSSKYSWNKTAEILFGKYL